MAAPPRAGAKRDGEEAKPTEPHAWFPVCSPRLLGLDLGRGRLLLSVPVLLQTFFLLLLLYWLTSMGSVEASDPRRWRYGIS